MALGSWGVESGALGLLGYSVADAGAVQFPQGHPSKLAFLLAQLQLLLQPLGHAGHQRITSTFREEAQFGSIGCHAGAITQLQAQQAGLKALEKILQARSSTETEASVQFQKQEILLAARTKEIPQDLLEAIQVGVAVESVPELMPANGTGAEIKAGQRVTVDYVAINGNDGTELDSTYGQTKQRIILDGSSLLKPVYDAIVGQKVGVRVLASANITDRLGAWALFVFDVIDATDVPTSATGTPVTPDPKLPAVTVQNGVPTIATPSGAAPTSLVAQVLIKGSGPAITAGQTVLMQYTGIIWATGKVFDSSWASGAVEFPVGTGQVIAGFDEGIVGLTLGSRVLLVIPPDKGYGSDGNSQAGISGTDTLVFVVDLLAAD